MFSALVESKDIAIIYRYLLIIIVFRENKNNQFFVKQKKEDSLKTKREKKNLDKCFYIQLDKSLSRNIIKNNQN